MTVTVNGARRELEVGATVSDLVVQLSDGSARRGIAVALNDAVVPRHAWADTTLTDDDRVEVLTAVQGG